MVLHVCHLINSLGRGGAEKVIKQIAHNSPPDIKNTVCYLGGPDTMADEIRTNETEVYPLEGHFHYDPFALYRLLNLIRKKDFDILHSHLPVSIWIGRLIGKLSGVKIVSTHHSVPQNYQAFSRTMERLTRPLDHRTISVSREVGRHVSPGSKNQITIHNGIDVCEFANDVEKSKNDLTELPPLNDSEVFLNVGRYTHVKRQIDLIKAMDRITDTYPKAHLIIVGWGELEDELRGYAEERDLSSHVTVTGPTSKIEKYYSISDVFALSSELEGFGIVLLEAMAAKLPTVATDLPSIREIVRPGKTGELVSVGDSEELAKGMIRCYENRDLYGSCGFQHARSSFDINDKVNDYCAQYRELTGKNNS